MKKSLISNRKILIRIENFYDYDKLLKKTINSKIIKKNLKILFKKRSDSFFKEKINFKSPGCGLINFIKILRQVGGNIQKILFQSSFLCKKVLNLIVV